jgi:hypothetical protein
MKPPCSGKLDIMFPVARERAGKRQREDDAMPAKRICSGCFMSEECFLKAIENDERVGVWGGVNFGFTPERVRVIKEYNLNGRIPTV